MFEIVNQDKKARTGILETRHDKIETPFFMPVATKISVKHISSEELNNLADAIISNAFILYLNPGLNLIKKAKGIHNLMNFQKVIFTDSGGFQMLDDTFLSNVNDNGVILKNPFDGKKHFITPEKVALIQQELKSDVAMVLDDVPHHIEKKYIVESLKRTHDWALRFKKEHKDSKQLVFGIAQGSIYKDLRKKSCQFISSLDFEGIALGGLCIGEPKNTMYKIIDYSEKFIPKNKPRYLMGVGSPLDLLQSVEHGIDIFDSCFPTRNARHGAIYTSKGIVRITNKKYKDDLKTLDKSCECIVCKNYAKAYLNYLFRVKEPIGLRLASYHNLHFIKKLMENIKISIKENRFSKFKRDFIKSYSQNQ